MLKNPKYHIEPTVPLLTAVPRPGGGIIRKQKFSNWAAQFLLTADTAAAAAETAASHQQRTGDTVYRLHNTDIYIAIILLAII